MMARKKRSDSVDTRTEIMKMAVKGILPPAYVALETEEMPFWNAITEARAEWTKVDLIHAANLARTMQRIEHETKMLKEEGSVVVNHRGTQIMNPRFSALETLSRRSVMLSAKLQVHSAATIGEIENNKNKNAKKRKSIEAMTEDEDDLIGKPVSH